MSGKLPRNLEMLIFFHIWDMAANPPILFEKTIEDIRPHIPSDNAAGKWSDVEIRLRN